MFGRRVVVHAWQSAKQEFARLLFERDALKAERDDLQRQLSWVLREVSELTASLRELRAATLARQKAGSALAELHRQRDIERARCAPRDPTQRVH